MSIVWGQPIPTPYEGDTTTNTYAVIALKMPPLGRRQLIRITQIHAVAGGKPFRFRMRTEIPGVSMYLFDQHTMFCLSWQGSMILPYLVGDRDLSLAFDGLPNNTKCRGVIFYQIGELRQ